MRSRNIKIGFWENESLGKLSHFDRLLFIGLWCLADREGKLEDRPDKIRHLLFGYDKKSVNVENGLCNLMSLHLITRYDMSGHGYIKIPNFIKHQTPHPHEAKSKIPDPVDCRDMSLHVTKCHSDILNPDITEHVPFSEFYSLYPKKQARADAEKAWNVAFKESVLTKTIWEEKVRPALLAQSESEQWLKENGQFIPYPATWIRRRRWEDQIETKTEVPNWNEIRSLKKTQ